MQKIETMSRVFLKQDKNCPRFFSKLNHSTKISRVTVTYPSPLAMSIHSLEVHCKMYKTTSVSNSLLTKRKSWSGVCMHLYAQIVHKGVFLFANLPIYFNVEIFGITKSNSVYIVVMLYSSKHICHIAS